MLHVRCAAVEAEDHSPVGPHGDGPQSFLCAFQGVQPVTRHVHMVDGRRRVSRGQNILELGDMFRVHSARIVIVTQPLQSRMANTVNHAELSRDTCRMSI